MALVDMPRSKIGAASSSSSKYNQNSLKSSSSASKLAAPLPKPSSSSAIDVQSSVAAVSSKKSSPSTTTDRSRETKRRRSPPLSSSTKETGNTAASNVSGNDSAAKASSDAVAAPCTAGVSAPLIFNPDYPNMPRLYRKVEINLENSLLHEDKLNNAPSLQDGMSSDLEQDLRFLGCELIQSASIMLKLPQVAAATGQILYQRFYYSKSFVRYFFEVHTAMACINLASKIEEAPRRVRDVVNVFHHLRQLYRIRQLEKRANSKKLENRRPAPMMVDSKYSALKNDVIKAERRVLKELGFCVHVKHPHKLIPTYMRALNAEDNQALAQKSWNYMNDSLRSDIFLRFSPETVACACIHLAWLNLQIPIPKVVMPSNSTVLNWWQLFTDDDVPDVSLSLLKLYAYRKKKLSWDELESKVNKLRQRLIEKQAADKITGGIENTPNPYAASAPNAPIVKKTADTSSLTKSNDKEKAKRENSSENDRRRNNDQIKQDDEIVDRQRGSPRSYSSSRKKLKSSPKSRESRKLAKKERNKSKENNRDRSTIRPVAVIPIDDEIEEDFEAPPVKRRTKMMNGNSIDDCERYENRNYYRKSPRSPSRHRDKSSKKYHSRSRSRSPPSQYKRSKGGDLKR
uniref:Cyclin-like domain-containing protein n=1 Tax=Romanomermis culicivorax TaxID=13658 RepID=A0A915JPE0_ROMCU